MSSDLITLLPEFKTKVQQLIADCTASGYEMRPYFTLRDPFEQAKLWRQSRTKEEIEKKIAGFKAAGAVYLAHCLESVGPQNGEHVTDTPPGFSWHQWGQAVDCFWVVNGQTEWSLKRLVNGKNGYAVYADAAVKLGLTPGGHWKSLKDWPHVQYQAAANPGQLMSIQQIDDEMKRRFGT